MLPQDLPSDCGMETKQDLLVTSSSANFSSLLVFISPSLSSCLELVDQLCTENEELNEYLVHGMQLTHNVLLFEV